MARTLRAAILVSVTALVGCGSPHQPKAGTVLDEAARAGLAPEHFQAAPDDYFHDMDVNLVHGQPHRPFTQQEIEGRNTWIVWTGGDDRLWDRLTTDSLGTFDLLKTISSHKPEPYKDPHAKLGDKPKYLYGYGRHNRFSYLGLVNEPCFTEATGPDPNHFGLWLDQRDPACPPDPFADETRFPGVKIGARGSIVKVGSYYGEPTGIVGLRLFPNPDFDETARRNWSSERYYTDSDYYLDPKLVRPYRVGMSCGFCHVGPNPIRPPADPENPKWENLSSNVGAQYFWWDRIFNWRTEAVDDSIFYQALHVSRPGTLDTSLVSTDNINNPRSMNAVYYLLPRMLQARKWGKETLTGGSLDNRQFNNDVPPGDLLAQFFAPPSTTWTPRVLKDGADSVGALGALNRVYLNIGLFSEEWTLHFRPILGGQPISPIPIKTAEQNSVYWRATERQTTNMARFFLASTDPHHLKDAPGGDSYLKADDATLRTGKLVFADRCARCHSTKLPDLPNDIDLENANGPNYMQAWNRYWQWTKTDAFKSEMRRRVLADDFLDDNYLSTELRVPASLLGINACSPLATNAVRDNVWDNFSSESYKTLPSAGSVKIRDPRNGNESDYILPDGGRGYIRPASLVSLWSTSPFLQNNTVGSFDKSPAVADRMKSFDIAIWQMLDPSRREKDTIFPAAGPGVGVIDRMTADAYLDVPVKYVQPFLRPLLPLSRALVPSIGGDKSFISIGPFPKGFPVGLITNVDLLGENLSGADVQKHQKQLLALIEHAVDALKTQKDFAKVLDGLVNDLLNVSKCKDFVVNKGHYFGTDYFGEEPGLSNAEKTALIEYLKTF